MTEAAINELALQKLIVFALRHAVGSDGRPLIARARESLLAELGSDPGAKAAYDILTRDGL